MLIIKGFSKTDDLIIKNLFDTTSTEKLAVLMKKSVKNIVKRHQQLTKK